MKTQFEQMVDGLNDVEAFLAGEQDGFKAHVPQEVDVKAIRYRLCMTQARFSDTFGFSLDTIKHWEGGKRTPESPARTLLTVIDKNPAVFAAAVGSSKPTTVHVRVDRKRHTSSGATKLKTYSAKGGKKITKVKENSFLLRRTHGGLRNRSSTSAGVLEPVISTHDHHVSNDFSMT